jgi:hypothetical protein
MALVDREQPVVEFVKVIMEVPAVRPVTKPALSTEATALVPETQVPPVIGVKAVVAPIQIEVEAAVTVGKAFTVTFEVVLLR